MSRTTEALTLSLVRGAARIAPAALSARLEEEWLADMCERRSGASRLRFAIGCYWASVAIGFEHRPLSVPVASTARGGAALLVEPPRFFSPNTATFGLVLALHAAVFCILMMAATKFPKPLEPPHLVPRFIDQPAPPIKPTPPTIDKIPFDQPRLPPLLPPQEPVVDATVPDDTSNPNPVLSQLPVTAQSSPARAVVRIPGGAGAAFPHPDEYYPDVSKRLEEQGATVLQVCVDVAGRLNADPLRLKTSGSARLDAAAIRLAKAGSGHYRPTTEDGRPVADCYPMKIRFQLRN